MAAADGSRLMKLLLFTIALLLLPLAGLNLSGGEWSRIASPADDEGIAAALHTSMMLLLYTLLLNHAIKRMTGSAALDPQRFFIAFAAGALQGWLMSYLNLYVASWMPQPDQSWQLQLLLYTPVFALTAPAMLVTRAFFAAFPVLTTALAGLPALRIPNLTVAAILAALALSGLAAGAAQPQKLDWLLWASPPLLLYALQWRQHSPAGVALLAMLAGIVVGNFAVASYQSNAALAIVMPVALTQAGYALFGLLCLQLIELTASLLPIKNR